MNRRFLKLSMAEKQLLLQGLWVIGDEARVDPALMLDYWALRKELEIEGVRHAELAAHPKAGSGDV